MSRRSSPSSSGSRLFRPLHEPDAQAVEPPAPSARQPVQRHHAGRQQVLADIRRAAIEEFSRLGFEGTKMQAIASNAGLTKQQLLYYCGSKDELYASLLYEVVHAWRDTFVLDAGHESSPAQMLRQYVICKLDHALDQGPLSRLFTTEILAGGGRIARYWPEMLESARQKVELLSSWMDAGLLRRREPLLLLQQIWGMTQYWADYAAQTQAMMGQSLPRKVIAEELVATVLLACGLEPDEGETKAPN